MRPHSRDLPRPNGRRTGWRTKSKAGRCCTSSIRARRRDRRIRSMTEPRSSSARPATRVSGRRPYRLPNEIGVIAALIAMMVVIGVSRPRFLNPINLLSILGNTTFLGMLSIGMVFLLAIREIDLSVGWIFNFSAVFSALADGRRRRSVVGGPGRRVFRGRPRAGEWNSRRGLAAAGDHRDARHVFDVPGPIVGRQQRPCGRSPRAGEQLLHFRLDEAVWRRPRAGGIVRRAGDPHAFRSAPHSVRLSRPGGRQQSRSGWPRGHSDRAGPVADARPDGRDLRAFGGDVCRLSRSDRSQ